MRFKAFYPVFKACFLHFWPYALIVHIFPPTPTQNNNYNTNSAGTNKILEKKMFETKGTR